MDLSKRAKKIRDRAEEPLWDLEELLHDLEECQTRLDAAIKVWPETTSTLKPALKKQNALAKKLIGLQGKLSGTWKQGHKSKWIDQ
jgi:exonuclease VII small subunit